MGTQITPQAIDCPEPARLLVMDLTFTAHLYTLTNLGSTLSFINLGVFSAPWRQSLNIPSPLSSGVGFTEINPFLVSPPHVSLPLDSVSGKWLDMFYLGPLEPGALAPLCPSCSPGLKPGDWIFWKRIRGRWPWSCGRLLTKCSDHGRCWRPPHQLDEKEK